MNLFRRGRHRHNRWSITVTELAAESKRIPIADLFALNSLQWAKRGDEFMPAAHVARLTTTSAFARSAATAMVGGAR